MSYGYQLESWCNPYGHSDMVGLLGQIQFATDEDQLDQQDLSELSRLSGPFSIVLLGRRVHMWCVGHADHRARTEYNQNLGLRRAQSVQQALLRMFGHNRFFSVAPVESRGENQAHWPTPNREQMAEDRRVDVFTSTIPNRPPLRLPMEQIFGRLPPEIQIREVYDTAGGPSNWTPATRTSRPVSPSNTNTPGDSTRNHPAAVIPGGLRLANQASIEERIGHGLDEIQPIVRWRLMDHGSGGVLIVAAIDVRQQGGQEARQVMYVRDYGPHVFAEPGHAIGHWRRQPLGFEAPIAPPPYGRKEYRFFWATRR